MVIILKRKDPDGLLLGSTFLFPALSSLENVGFLQTILVMGGALVAASHLWWGLHVSARRLRLIPEVVGYRRGIAGRLPRLVLCGTTVIAVAVFIMVPVHGYPLWQAALAGILVGQVVGVLIEVLIRKARKVGSAEDVPSVGAGSAVVATAESESSTGAGKVAFWTLFTCAILTPRILGESGLGVWVSLGITLGALALIGLVYPWLLKIALVRSASRHELQSGLR